ncbi:hypothetical protein DKX38_006408 [Salix brachista]|uniref:Reverse transcriptase zinc-binding domain-containing protein n=1 Tax=Salix brachista TaxID=2182728 RepID=A0A5N5N4R0_9ROSI|nr:hypothetical protein DKX38_006408 [Salix brachista]
MQGVQEQIAMQGWEFTSNIQAAHHCRILVGWNANKVKLQCIHAESQWLTCEAVSLHTKEAITVTFVYGLNSPAERSHLWNYIRNFKPASTNTLWVVLGDFNAALRPSDRQGGDTRWLKHHEEFRESINNAGIFQPPYTGVHLTWDNEASPAWEPDGAPVSKSSPAWELIRNHFPAKDTHLLIWQKEHIPRHAFILWMAAQGRLRTRDRLSTTTAIPSLLCVLCNQETESHDHLYFRCHYTRAVWKTVNGHAGLTWPSMPWNQLIDWAVIAHNHRRNVNSMIARLILAASVYNVWQERNRRIFSHHFQGRDYLASEIIQGPSASGYQPKSDFVKAERGIGYLRGS